jgi:DNA-binding MarR family transcriptional regulator
MDDKPSPQAAPTATGLSRGAALGDQEKKAATCLFYALKDFTATAMRDTMRLQYIMSFLLVAMEEGLSVGEYAERAKVSASVMSRHLLDIGQRNRHMEAGFGLVDYRPNPIELRKHEYFLTPKGRALAHQILGNWKG